MRELNAASMLVPPRTTMRLAQFKTLSNEWQPDLNYLVQVRSPNELRSLIDLRSQGLANLILHRALGEAVPSGTPAVFVDATLLEEGDVLVAMPEEKTLQVLYRESDMHHTVFLTNRCNSNCLMCSQPPTRHDDSWVVDEALSVAAHMRNSPGIVGFTGGEPLLLGHQLRDVIEQFATLHPRTVFEVLTNGRLFSDNQLAREILGARPQTVTWMVPLYGPVSFIHDFVVQSPGAFDQTTDGILTLHSYGQPIQLRIVLIKPVLEALPGLCDFIARNFPFVREVAFMGCEPIGFALANRELCEVDISDWHQCLIDSVKRLRRSRVSSAIMNLPHCSVPSELWDITNRSISDWKQVYVGECKSCSMVQLCCGLFAWSGKGTWQPTRIKAIKDH